MIKQNIIHIILSAPWYKILSKPISTFKLIFSLLGHILLKHKTLQVPHVQLCLWSLPQDKGLKNFQFTLWCDFKLWETYHYHSCCLGDSQWCTIAIWNPGFCPGFRIFLLDDSVPLSWVLTPGRFNGARALMISLGKFYVEFMIELSTMRIWWLKAWVAFCDGCAKNHGDPNENVVLYQFKGAKLI